MAFGLPLLDPIAKCDSTLPEPLAGGIEIDGCEVPLREPLGPTDEITQIRDRSIERGVELELPLKFCHPNKRHCELLPVD